jgi:hypothetical protein
MPTFKKKPEVVDARQFTGGLQNGSDIAFWVNSNDSLAHWLKEIPGLCLEKIHVQVDRFKHESAYMNDWIVRRQDGHFEVLRPEEFNEQYDQV